MSYSAAMEAVELYQLTKLKLFTWMMSGILLMHMERMATISIDTHQN